MTKDFFCFAAIGLALGAVAHAPAVADDADPYLWLEDVEGERALAWVEEQNAQSLAALESDPRFQPMYEEALSVLTSDQRLALGQIHNGHVYNFWQDDDHVRGLWRRASVESYRAGAADWEVLIDYDALTASEQRNWVRGGVVCLTPDYVHCMIELSDGGKDAGYWREFSTREKQFVDGGFYLTESKSNLAWLNAETLIVGADTGEGSLTDSGYPRQVRILSRGADIDTSLALPS
ncbi:MAG: hypothetical protein AAFW68_13360 [Pseudomonadota bacterium]